MDDILQAARRLRPGSSWNLRGDKIEPADDFTTGLVPPTDAELKDEIARYGYADARASVYPSLADQLDAIWKGGDAEEAMRNQIMAIKAQFPKP